MEFKPAKKIQEENFDPYNESFGHSFKQQKRLALDFDLFKPASQNMNHEEEEEHALSSSEPYSFDQFNY